jgi:hypothetical protein
VAALRRDALNILGLITARWRPEMLPRQEDWPGAAAAVLKRRCRVPSS